MALSATFGKELQGAQTLGWGLGGLGKFPSGDANAIQRYTLFFIDLDCTSSPTPKITIGEKHHPGKLKKSLMNGK
jgi:hypothetical protein